MDQDKRNAAFNKCLELTAKARKGQSYSTENDEDWEDVVNACGSQAYYLALVEDPDCAKKEKSE